MNRVGTCAGMALFVGAAWMLVHALWDAEWLLTFLALLAIAGGLSGALFTARRERMGALGVALLLALYLPLLLICGRFVVGGVAKGFGEPVVAHIDAVSPTNGRASLGAYAIRYHFERSGRTYRGESAAQAAEVVRRQPGDAIAGHALVAWPEVSGVDSCRGYRPIDLACLFLFAALPWVPLGTARRR